MYNFLVSVQTREWFRLKRRMDTGYKWKVNAKKDGNPTLDDLRKLRDLIKEK